jgi:hypothetical protein
MTAGARLAVVGAFALGAAILPAAPAGAELGPIRLASRSAAQQAGEAGAPAISADGHYLAFQGSLDGSKGVFRKDLASGVVTPVAAGSSGDPNAPGADAAAPSISAVGRYVAFTTAAQLDPLHDPQAGSKDVYVADMSALPPTYELASSRDGGLEGLTYGGGGGSEASGRVALSADGREVVFFTTAASNLTGDPSKTETPAGQVVLRNLATETTTLVSAERDSGTGAMTEQPVAGGGLIEGAGVTQGASLSADGSTVAWLGGHLPAQVPLSPEEAKTIGDFDAGGEAPYDEPLWRRVADGPGAPTRRVIGGEGSAGPFPNMTGKPTASPIGQAEGWLGAVGVDGVPQLSGDGRIVALIGNPVEATNLFIVDMSGGLSRLQAVHQLTREVSISASEGAAGINSLKNIPLNGHIFDLSMSADGRRIAFATARQRFPLAPPNLIGSAPSSRGAVELYLIDRDGETLERVTHGAGGSGEASLPASGVESGFGVTAPSFGGSLIAFASTASNLVAGDGNGASDAFTVEDDEAPRIAGGSSISAMPPARRRRPGWRLRLHAFSLPDGAVSLVAVVPAGGGLHAGVSAAVGAVPRPRRLDRVGARPRKGGPVALRLQLPARLRGLARSQEGLYAIARVSFHRRGRRTLHGQLQVRFRAHPAKRGRR